jgi:LPS sulfotransferase NodH
LWRCFIASGHRKEAMGDSWDQFGQDYDHDTFVGKPNTYLIASTPRSGSHFFGHLLFSTGVLGSPLEYFEPVHARKWMEKLGAEDFETLLTLLYERRTSPSGWFGIKAHWSQFAPIADSDELVRFLDIDRYIKIRRRDRIAQAISAVIARQTQAWISFQTAAREPQYHLPSIRAMIAVIDSQASEWDEFFARKGISPLIVEYEDLIENPEVIVEKVLRDLGVARSGVKRTGRLPERQASDLNDEWRERYLSDLSALSA